MEEDPLEVGHQAVDVHQLEAQAVDVLQQVAQEVDVHRLEVLEVAHQVEVGLEMDLEVQVRRNSVYWSVKQSVN